MSILPKLEDFLHSSGRPLTEINDRSEEIALIPSDALYAIHLLYGSQIAILGGDVLSDTSGKLQYTLENWHCEQMSGENPMTFTRRSHDVAKDFITKLMKRGDNNVYVVLVYS
jgi:hypothetical protein